MDKIIYSKLKTLLTQLITNSFGTVITKSIIDISLSMEVGLIAII